MPTLFPDLLRSVITDVMLVLLLSTMKGATVTLSCQPDDGLIFEKWTDDKDGGKTVSTSREFKITIDGPKAYTATAKIEPMDASVTVKKDNTA